MSGLIEFGKQMFEAMKPSPHVGMADDFFRILKDWRDKVERDLPTGQAYEIKFILADGNYIYADTYGYENPCTLVVQGRDSRNNKVIAVMHYQTAQVVFVPPGA